MQEHDEVLGSEETYIWKAGDEVVSEGISARGLDHTILHFLAGVFPLGPYQPILYIFVDGRVEEDVLLLDQSDLATPPFWVDVLEL